MGIFKNIFQAVTKETINREDIRYHTTTNYYLAINSLSNELLCDWTSNGGWVCWGRLMERLKGDAFYSIKIKINIYKTTLSKGAKGTSKHGCIFGNDVIEKFIEDISKVYIPFTYKIIANENDPIVKLEIDFERKNKKETLWTLSLIRHLYEFPFNAFLHEALALQDLEEFKDEHLTNILQVIATTGNSNRETTPNYLYYSNDQSLGHSFRRLVSVDHIKSVIGKGEETIKCYQKTLTEEQYKSLIRFESERKIDKITVPINSYAYWFDHSVEEFEDFRIKAYLNNYKILKNEN